MTINETNDTPDKYMHELYTPVFYILLFCVGVFLDLR